MDVIKSQQLTNRSIEKVIVHPLVLLSIVDNYYRVAKDTRKRVVGVLLGSTFKGTVDVTNSYAVGKCSLKGTVDGVTNSYAVPFEEDDKDPSIWFLDHNYHEEMFSMFKRINAKEHVVGWYSTGPKLRKNDLDIHGLFNDYAPNPVLVIIDVQPTELGLPTKAYYAIEEVNENATQKSKKVFVHVSSEIAAHEVEEIGVEHLLRDVKDTTISTLATEVSGKLEALKGLDARLKEIRSYLDLVIEGKLPLNHFIQIFNIIFIELKVLQDGQVGVLGNGSKRDIFNLLPNLNVAELVKAFAGIYLTEADRLLEMRTLAFELVIYLLPVNFAVKTNDQMLVIYLSSLIRSVIALHNLINNKLLNKEHEKAEDAKPATQPPVAGI
ncbi:26S proteasome non-ATPase regulatory subunit 7 homolog A [Tanacetum coccineum]|uniref:26S proteasome non-ATPase regulatory subunit 7 homolog A n=1 Tax=Tanacetum coccineum TaxID=301880 RepID=A0ABQ4WWR0_9ASTR